MTIRSRKHPAGRYLATMAMLMAPVVVHAVEAAPADSDVTEVIVKGTVSGYKATRDSSPKHTQALVDTPQTLSVIKKELLSEQNATTLSDALHNTPGITMQLGENGSTAAGDTFQLRGFSAQSSLFLDGIRDLGAVSRDVFDVDQIEIAKGPAGSDIGRGASSGYINLVSKLPTLGGGSSLSASAYSQGGARVTADGNVRTGASSALRLNLMAQDVDVPGRSVVKNTGWGIAPAYGTGIGTDTRFYLFAQVLHQENTPDGGIPVIGWPGFFNANGAIMAGQKVDRRNYYGSPSDREKVDAAMLTAKIEHDFAGGWRLTDTARYAETKMNRILTGIGANASSGIAIGAGGSAAEPSTWVVNRTRQRVVQDNLIIANATNFTGIVYVGAWTHDISTGVELNYEAQKTPSFAVAAGVPIPSANLYHPNINDALPMPVANGAYTDGSVTTASAYVFDTAKHGPWLLSAGLRLDSYSVRTDGVAITTATSNPPLPAGVLLPLALRTSGTIASWNVGVVYKPRHNGSLYIAYGNALTPPGSANLTLSSAVNNLANAAFKPTQTDNLEVGTKWDLLHERLSLTAAWYDTVAKNELALADAIDPTSFHQTGERDINGIELGLIGQLTPKWQVSAGVQTLHTKIIKGTTGNTASGAATRWSPDLTGTVWMTFKVTPRLTVGAGASYTSDQKLVVDPAAVVQTLGLAKIPAYWVANAMASFTVTPHAALQLNVYNLLNAGYISTLNNGGARIIAGQPQAATLTLSYKF